MKITHDSNKKQLTAEVDGGTASLSYDLKKGNVMDIYSTFVPEEARGKKVADLLVREAIKIAKERRLKIIPSCPYVGRWFDAHPGEKEILFSF